MSEAEVAERPKIEPAFIDMDEWRETPRPHRDVHGGFDGVHTRFSLYSPPKEQYRGRFYQYLEGRAGGREVMLQMTSFDALMASCGA